MRRATSKSLYIALPLVTTLVWGCRCFVEAMVQIADNCPVLHGEEANQTHSGRSTSRAPQAWRTGIADQVMRGSLPDT